MRRTSKLAALALFSWHTLVFGRLICEGQMTGTVNIQKPVYITVYKDGSAIVDIWTYPRKEPERERYGGVGGADRSYRNTDGGFNMHGKEADFKTDAGNAHVRFITCSVVGPLPPTAPGVQQQGVQAAATSASVASQPPVALPPASR